MPKIIIATTCILLAAMGYAILASAHDPYEDNTEDQMRAIYEYEEKKAQRRAKKAARKATT